MKMAIRTQMCSFIIFPMLAVAGLASTSVWADPGAGFSKSVKQEALQKKADLILWQRSGAGELYDASTYSLAMYPQFLAAHEQYYQWRYGNEFKIEMQQLNRAMETQPTN